MKISEVKKKFKDTWVLAEVLKEDKLNRALEVKPITTSRDKNEIYDQLAKLPDKKTHGKTFTTIYTGKIAGAFLF
ncbi:hypothetical protein HYU94_00610 [Candidatus Daviesbacteria bacterium]|nr:hypothetical protein [Candidatus Daviesbacteria bacterium]